MMLVCSGEDSLTWSCWRGGKQVLRSRFIATFLRASLRMTMIKDGLGLADAAASRFGRGGPSISLCGVNSLT